MKKQLLYLAGMLVIFAGTPVHAAGNTFNCPSSGINVDVTSRLPAGWWSTAQANIPLVGTEISTIGGKKTFVCLYRAYGNARISVMHEVPANAGTCRPARRGFRCSGSMGGSRTPPQTGGRTPPQTGGGSGALSRCAKAIQGNVAWDYKGNKKWAKNNLEQLCRGAESSLQPGICFNKVMHGGVNWGGGTQWKWQNALDLCQGSRNAKTTVVCFQKAVKKKQPWKKAIQACRAK